MAKLPLPRRRGLLFLALINLLGLVGLWVSQSLGSEHNWLSTLLANIPQHPYGLLTLGVLVGAVWRRNLPALALGLLALWIWLGPLMGLNLPNWPSLEAKSAGPTLRMMTFNLEQVSHFSQEQVARAILAENPQVVCLQEVRDRGSFVFSEFARRFAGWQGVQGWNVGLLSKYPVEGFTLHPMAEVGARRKILQATLRIRGQRITVLCVHYITTTLVNRRSLGLYFASFASEAEVRQATTGQLLELARRSPNPVVIGGDFNTTPRSSLYPQLRAELKDAFAEAGWGFGYTWNTSWPLLRIDYIWTKGLEPVRVRVPPIVVSDHRPVVAELWLP